jgi:hypothetical protein
VSIGLRILIGTGAVFLVIVLVLRQLRSEGIQGPDILEAVGVAALPLLFPGAAEMILKSLGGDVLPMFNRPEDRLALFLGGAGVLAGIVYGNLLALRRAWRNQRS